METWVQIPSRTLIWHGTQSGKAAKLKPSWSVGSTPTRVNETLCVGWALACPSGCNPPASCSAGSTPARRTRPSARSSSGSGYWPLTPVTRVQIPHGSMLRPSGATGRHATLRTSCPFGLGSSTLPLVTAGRAGARLAFIRPGCPDRYRGLQLPGFVVSRGG